MQTYARRAMLAAALATIGGFALGQPYGPGMTGGPGMGRGPGLGRMADPSAYLDGLTTQLSITAAQANAWDAYAEVVKNSRDPDAGSASHYVGRHAYRLLAGTTGYDEPYVRGTSAVLRRRP